MSSFSDFPSHQQNHGEPVPFELSDLHIRVARHQDLSEIAELLSDSFYPQVGIMRWFAPIMKMGIYEDLRQRLRGAQVAGCTCLVAVVSLPSSPSRVIGTVEVSFRSNYPLQIWSSHYPYLSNLAVQSECRKQGVAQKLLSACEILVAEAGFQNLYLHVLESNHPARQLYLKAGYRLKQADPLWCRVFLRRSRRLLLHKKLPSTVNVW